MAGFERPGRPSRPPRPRDPRGRPRPEGFDDFGSPGDRDDGFDPYDLPQHPFDPYPEDDRYDPPERTARRSSSGERTRSRRNLLWRWRRGFFVAGLLVMALVAAAVSAVAQVELPDPQDLELSSFICAADVVDPGTCGRNNAMARLTEEGDREYVKLEKINQVMIDAVIAAEDREFFEHQGIDPVGIGRALYRDLRSGDFSQGGSTITQQYVKNYYLTEAGTLAERTATRKIQEAVLAMKIEKELTKEEILEGYFNTIYFGRNAYGIQAASRAYFNVDAMNLTLEQASYLAGLIRAPSQAQVEDHPDEAARRRRTVLDAMLEEEYITQADRDRVDAIDLATYVVPKQSYRTNTTMWTGEAGATYGVEYITDYVRSEVADVLVSQGYSEEEATRQLAAGGLRVYTTINKDMQAAAYDAVYREVLVDPTEPAGSLVAIDDQGMVRAMVGGRDYFAPNPYPVPDPNDPASAFAQNNLAIARRPVGSTFKPIALARAAQDNISLQRSRLPAPPQISFEAEQNPCGSQWEPSNYSDTEVEGGSLDLLEATAQSSNTVYAQLMQLLGPDRVAEMAKTLGMDSDLVDETTNKVCLPVVLGTENSSALEMAEVYSTFANRGVHREPTIITRIEKVDNQSGDTTTLWDWANDPASEDLKVMAEPHADLVTHALRGVIDRGTARREAQLEVEAAGKTGTTQNNKDAWFVGYVPRLTAAVWMGYPVDWVDPGCDGDIPQDPTNPDYADSCASQTQPMRNVQGLSTVTGGSLPARIWRTFMEKVVASPGDTFTVPTDDQLRNGTTIGQPAEEVPDEPPGDEPPEDEGDPDSTTTSRGPGITIEPPTTRPQGSTSTTTTTRPGPPSGGGGGGLPAGSP